MDAGRVLEGWDGSEPLVLATIVKTIGHSYRKPGACMLLGRGGLRRGSISPGCLEADLAQRAELLLDEAERGKEGGPGWQRILYDMSSPDDLLWGEATGCGGSLTVLLERIEGALAAVLREAAGQGEERWLERRLQQGRIAYRLLAQPLRPAEAADAADAADRDMVRYVTHLAERPRLILFGAGDDSIPIAELAQRAGFRVVVADWREALCAPERFPGCELRCGTPEELLGELRIGPADYMLLCSHRFRFERELLERLAMEPPHYAGVLGSRRRIALLLDGLDYPGLLSGPVGLDIGGDGAEEIALSIAAELVAVRRRGVLPQPALARAAAAAVPLVSLREEARVAAAASDGNGGEAVLAEAVGLAGGRRSETSPPAAEALALPSGERDAADSFARGRSLETRSFVSEAGLADSCLLRPGRVLAENGGFR
ncbi:XdhC family protein [Paenibacillus albicereus]|uniref:XdhC family protein n=1 Tax=Paenibacillus albicereus TaxID=2726185 RepID=A0A6H2H1G2_9BACL|nr:XdhC/CoxI family protein [Paenibacillus albicereus]QJC53439.1 XdhC family protein [Paenibacillus albicereus]